jgi:hypothetical protein
VDLGVVAIAVIGVGVVGFFAIWFRRGQPN